MQYTDFLDITPIEFFEAVEYSLLMDIEASTKKKIEAKAIQRGFHYNKDLKAQKGGKINSKVLIEEYTKPTLYQAKFEANGDTTQIKYEITPIDDDACKIIYSETYTTSRKMSNWNYKLISFLTQRKGKKKIKKTLKAIEEYALSKRNNSDVVA